MIAKCFECLMHSYKRFLKVRWGGTKMKNMRFAIGQKYFVCLYNSLHSPVYVFLAKQVNKNVWNLAL